MGQVKTVSISGETKIAFDAVYPYVWVRNLGNSALTVWGDVGDTVSLSRLEAVRVITNTDCIYVSGTGSVEVIAQGVPDSPYKGSGSGGGGGSITVLPLTLTHNHQGADGGLSTAYSPVEVQIEMDTLNVTENGVYQIDTTQDGWDTVTVNVHDDKYDLLYGNWYGYTTGSSSIGTKRLVKPITEYDDIIIWTSFLFQGNEYTNFMRYPASEIAGKNYNMVASGGNYVIGSIIADGTEITDTDRQWQAIVAVYGIKVNNMERTTIFENTGSTNPATYSLPTGKTFSDYDEFIIIGEKDNYVYASYVPTSEIYVNSTYFGITIGSVGKSMYFSDNSTITDDTTQTILVKKIIGVKYTTSE